MHRRILALFGAALFVIGVGAAPAAAAGSDARAEHNRVVAHWTQERIRAAVPRDFALEPAHSFVVNRNPGGSGGGTAVTAASWTATSATVYRAAGKVYFEMGGSGYVCSGAVVEDHRSDYSLILTAAHCAFDESRGEFAANWLFIPQFDSNPTYTCASTAYGCWTAGALVVHRGYASAGGFNTQATLHDYAVAVVGPGGKSGGQLLESAVGAFAIRFSGVPGGALTYAFGYPAEGRFAGSDLVYSSGPVGSDPYNSNLTYRLKSDLNGGSSGGPWLTDFTAAAGVGTLTSVNSYTYRSLKGAMHGPKFDSKTQAVYSAADSATGNTIVP